MPSRRTWLWFALILLANFLLVRLLFPGPEAPIEVPHLMVMPFCLKDVLVIREIGGMGHAIARRQGSGKAVLLADFYKKTPNSAAESMKSVASSSQRSCHAPLLSL